MTVCIE